MWIVYEGIEILKAEIAVVWTKNDSEGVGNRPRHSKKSRFYGILRDYWKNSEEWEGEIKDELGHGSTIY